MKFTNKVIVYHNMQRNTILTCSFSETAQLIVLRYCCKALASAAKTTMFTHTVLTHTCVRTCISLFRSLSPTPYLSHSHTHHTITHTHSHRHSLPYTHASRTHAHTLTHFVSKSHAHTWTHLVKILFWSFQWRYER